MSSDKKATYVTRNEVINLLSDQEAATVSTIESGPWLAEGEEFLDLQKLEAGVQVADGANPPIGHVLPRKGVRPRTWVQILSRLKPADA